jgi:hypothetical protein
LSEIRADVVKHFDKLFDNQQQSPGSEDVFKKGLIEKVTKRAGDNQ